MRIQEYSLASSPGNSFLPLLAPPKKAGIPWLLVMTVEEARMVYNILIFYVRIFDLYGLQAQVFLSPISDTMQTCFQYEILDCLETVHYLTIIY